MAKLCCDTQEMTQNISAPRDLPASLGMGLKDLKALKVKEQQNGLLGFVLAVTLFVKGRQSCLQMTKC
jgi:hypothetical protein